MKRDMDKVRGVLLALEANNGPFLMTMTRPRSVARKTAERPLSIS